MAVTGYIQIHFTPNYTGDHRVCYRIGSSGPYTCILVSCITDPCTATISPISFENESCDSVVYEGYVQAACEPEDSFDNAVFWTKTFNPTPICKPYTLTCTGATGGIIDVDVDAGGRFIFNYDNNQIFECLFSYTGDQVVCGVWNGYSLYQRLQDPAMSTFGCTTAYGPGNYCTNLCKTSCQCIFIPEIIATGTGTGFVAQAAIGFGGIKVALKTTNGGILNQGFSPSGPINAVYNNVSCINNNITIPTPSGNISIPGIGEQKFKVTVQGGQVILVEPYLFPSPNIGKYFYDGVYGETFSFNPADIGGIQNVVCKTINNSIDLGEIIGVNIINSGTGYQGNPPVVLTLQDFNDVLPSCPPLNPGEIDLQAVIGSTGCPEFDPGLNCEGDPYITSGLIPSLPAGTAFDICYPSAIPVSIPSEYQVTPSAECCYDCISLQVVADVFDPLPAIVYTDCNTGNIVTYNMTSYGATIACAVKNSYASTQSSTQFIELGLCIS